MRVVLGISYSGTQYQGWQSQVGGQTVQDQLEEALRKFTDRDEIFRVSCAGRTDAGVHALNQVVHFDIELERQESSWVRGTNRYLPNDIAVQWCNFAPQEFHSRQSAIGRRYVYIVKASPVRPSIEQNRVGWCWLPLDKERMLKAASYLLGEHDFSAFRAAQCQAPSPIKNIRELNIVRQGEYWRFEFEATAFLHHMIRNIMGELIAVGTGKQPPEKTKEVLEGRQREFAAPTYAADGLYFLGPQYEASWGLPLQAQPEMLIFPAYGI